MKEYYEVLTETVSVVDMRKDLADVMNGAFYRDAIVNVERRERQIACLVPYRLGQKTLKENELGEIVSVADMRKDLADVLNRAFYGNEVVPVERRGRPIAFIVSPERGHDVLEQLKEQSDKEIAKAG